MAEQTKAGDYVYDLADLDELAPQRGDLIELLAECVLAVSPPVPEGTAERLSNGDIADALFAALDAMVTTEEQWATLKRVIEEARND